LFFVRLFHPCQTSKKNTSEPLSALCALGHLRLVPLASEDEKAITGVLERVWSRSMTSSKQHIASH
jgi:hypothetical protein